MRQKSYDYYWAAAGTGVYAFDRLVILTLTILAGLLAELVMTASNVEPYNS